MSRGIVAFILVESLILGVVIFWTKRGGEEPEVFEPKPRPQSTSSAIPLPVPRAEGEMSLEEAILKRRSKREFLDKPLTLEQVSQILWSAQGVTNEASGYRTAPSAGALYPLEVYLVVGENGVEGFESGVYHYFPENHSLEKLLDKYLRSDLMSACLGQSFIADAPVNLVITAEYERTTGKYGERGIRYAHLEAGHAAQNVYLQTTALGLGTVTIGAFEDEEVSEVLRLPPEHKPLYVMPVGHTE